MLGLYCSIWMKVDETQHFKTKTLLNKHEALDLIILQKSASNPYETTSLREVENLQNALTGFGMASKSERARASALLR